MDPSVNPPIHLGGSNSTSSPNVSNPHPNLNPVPLVPSKAVQTSITATVGLDDEIKTSLKELQQRLDESNRRLDRLSKDLEPSQDSRVTDLLRLRRELSGEPEPEKVKKNRNFAFYMSYVMFGALVCSFIFGALLSDSPWPYVAFGALPILPLCVIGAMREFYREFKES